MLDGGDEFVVAEQAAQTAPVVDHSVVAVVGEADDQGDELAFGFAQRGGAGHGRFVEALVCGHGAGVERVDGQDVVDPAVGGVHDPGVQLAEGAVPVVVRNDLDARHAPASHTGVFRGAEPTNSTLVPLIDFTHMTQAVDRIERLLRECPTGEVWALVGYASAAGLCWLDAQTVGRPVRLLIGDTRTGFATDKVSPADRAGAIRFIKRADVMVTNWYRRKGGYRTVHAKAWAVMPHGAGGRPAGVVIGSANLTNQGLHHNTELVAQVVGDEAQRVATEMGAALDESWDAKANLLKRLEGGAWNKSQTSRRRSTQPGRQSPRPVTSVKAPKTALPSHPDLAAPFPSPESTGRDPIEAGHEPIFPRHDARPPYAPEPQEPTSQARADGSRGKKRRDHLGTNPTATMALVLGIVAFLSNGLTAPFGLVMGHLGRHRAKKLAVKGRRIAMAGLICSYICLPAFLGLWVLPLVNGS